MATAACASFPEVGKHIAFDGRLLHGVLRTMVPSAAGAAGAAGAGATVTGADKEGEGGGGGEAGAGVGGDGWGGGGNGGGGNGGGGNGGGGGGGGGEGKYPYTSGFNTSGGGGDESRRVTFLGNVWLNHRPKGVKPLPEGVLSSLRKPTSVPPAAAAPTPIVIPEPVCGPPPPPPADGGGGGGAEGWAETGCYFGWSGDDLKLGGWVPVGLLKNAAGSGVGAVASGTGTAGTGTVRVVLPEGCNVRVIENNRRAGELKKSAPGNGDGNGDGDDAAAEDESTAKRQRREGD